MFDLAMLVLYLALGGILAVPYAYCAGGPLWVAAPLGVVAPIVTGILVGLIVMSIKEGRDFPGGWPRIIRINATLILLVSLPVVMNGVSRLGAWLGHEAIGSIFYALRWWSLLVLPIPAAVFILVLRKREQRESAEEASQT